MIQAGVDERNMLQLSFEILFPADKIKLKGLVLSKALSSLDPLTDQAGEIYR